jgi:hypothetical protein
VFLNNRLDDLEGFKGRIFEISFPIHLTHSADRIAIPTLFWDILGLIFSTEEASGKGIIDNNIEAVAFAGRDELVLEGASDGIIHSLINGRSDPSIVLTMHHDFGNLKCGEI